MSLFVSNLIQATAAPTTGEPTPATSWQWKRSGADISGATESSYTATVADTGQDISVVQTATNVVGVASASSTALGPVLPFTPLVLFAGGAQGTWYDPADTATLFQDSAGTTPVTAVEQPVGLMLDKSQGLVLGPELGSSRNLVANWTAYGTNTVVQDGDAVKVTYVNNSNGAYVFLVGAGITTGKRYEVTFEAKTNTGNTVTLKASDGSTDVISAPLTDSYQTFTYYPNYLAGSMIAGLTNGSLGAGEVYWVRNISVKELPGNHAFQTTSASRPVLSARYNLLTGTNDISGYSLSGATRTTGIADPFGGTQAITLTATAPNAQIFSGIFNPGGSGVVSVYIRRRTGTGIIRLPTPGYVLTDITSQVSSEWTRVTLTGSFSNMRWLVQLDTSGDAVDIFGSSLVASQAPSAYQRVNTATDYETTGFLPYLKFDGVDDSLSTNSINFTSTDKMSVFAGVRKLSDAATGMLVELGASGPFGLYNYSIGPGWTWTGLSTAVVTAPITNVLTGTINTATATSLLRINAATASSGSPGFSGNFANSPLYIGRRNNANLPLNGQLYSMIIVGKAVNEVELTSTEDYIAEQTGVTLA